MNDFYYYPLVSLGVNFIFRDGKGSYEKPISWILHGLATWCMAGLVGAGSVRRPPPVRPQPCCSYTSPPPDTGHVIIVCSRDFNIWFNGTWNFVDRITLQLAAKIPTCNINTLNAKLNAKWQRLNERYYPKFSCSCKLSSSLPIQ